MKQQFYTCRHCGNMMAMIHDAGVPVQCCGEKMQNIEAGVVEASLEKHVPVAKIEGNLVLVEIGSVLHPMTEEHLIEWVAVETKDGYQVKYFAPTDTPEVAFALKAGDEIVGVYAYCNLHGLWKADI